MICVHCGRPCYGGKGDYWHGRIGTGSMTCKDRNGKIQLAYPKQEASMPARYTQRKILQEQIAELQQQLDALPNLPKEPSGTNKVVRFSVRFKPTGVVYTYVAIKSPSGWYTTTRNTSWGNNPPVPCSWDTLMSWRESLPYHGPVVVAASWKVIEREGLV